MIRFQSRGPPVALERRRCAYDKVRATGPPAGKVGKLPVAPAERGRQVRAVCRVSMHATHVRKAIVQVDDRIVAGRMLARVRGLTGARRTRDQYDRAGRCRQPAWRMLRSHRLQRCLDPIAPGAKHFEIGWRVIATRCQRSNVIAHRTDADPSSALARLAQVPVPLEDALSQAPPGSTRERALIGARLFRPRRAQRMRAMQRRRIRHRQSPKIPLTDFPQIPPGDFSTIPIGTFLADNYR